MIFTQKQTIPSTVKEINYEVAKCIKCESDDIKLEEYDDQYGYISTATCKSCKNKVRVEAGIKSVIEKWNSLNDIPTLIKAKTEKISSLKEDIKQLIEIQKERNKKRKPTPIKEV